MIQLAIALKTRLCVYMYLPYVCVYIIAYVHTVIFMRNWKLWDYFIHCDNWEGKRNHNILNWGPVNTTVYEGHISGVTYIHIQIHMPIIWTIHILTHLLWPLYLTILLYTLHLGSSLFLISFRQTGDCLLPNLSGISKMALILSHFYFWWLLFKFSGPYPVNSFT